jgi:hypothetical protein
MSGHDLANLKRFLTTGETDDLRDFRIGGHLHLLSSAQHGFSLPLSNVQEFAATLLEAMSPFIKALSVLLPLRSASI